MCLFFVYKFRDSLTVSDDLNASVIFRRPSTISREDLVADVVITSNSGNARYFIRHLYNIGKILPHYSRLISRYRSFRNQQLDFALVNPLKGIVSTGWGRDCKDIDGRKAGTSPKCLTAYLRYSVSDGQFLYFTGGKSPLTNLSDTIWNGHVYCREVHEGEGPDFSKRFRQGDIVQRGAIAYRRVADAGDGIGHRHRF